MEQDAPAKSGSSAAPWKHGDLTGESKSSLVLNEEAIEGLYSSFDLNLENPEDVFWHVFSQLPSAVTVYPTENYYYWRFSHQGRVIAGNIRLPAGRRDRGVLSFGYSEFVEFPSSARDKGFSRSKYFTIADGLILKQGEDAFTYSVRYNDKTVDFHLNRIPQTPPRSFALREDETFVERTFDESGLQFFLLFNHEKNYFFWVLNDEDGVPETFRALAPDIDAGRRTGFVFWNDGDRKILAAIRKISVLRNDYFDGPFDQLADNYADEVNVRKYMELEVPKFRGRIDRYGYFTDVERPSRVALSRYGTYYSFSEAVALIEKAKAAEDARYFISRGGHVVESAKETTGRPVGEAVVEEEKASGGDGDKATGAH